VRAINTNSAVTTQIHAVAAACFYCPLPYRARAKVSIARSTRSLNRCTPVSVIAFSDTWTPLNVIIGVPLGLGC